MAKNLSDILLGISSGILKVANGGTGSSNGSLSLCTVDGTIGVGYISVPQNQPQSFPYTTALSDSGKHIFHSNATAHTFTIPANSSVAYPIGTVLTFINDTSSGVLSITITTDTMVWIPSGDTTATRSLAAGSMATAIKIASTKWFISGAGVS